MCVLFSAKLAVDNYRLEIIDMVKYAIYELQRFGFGDVAQGLQAGFVDWDQSSFCLESQPFNVTVVPSAFCLRYEYPFCIGLFLNNSNACLSGKGDSYYVWFFFFVFFFFLCFVFVK
jgi:hypothetical protein